MIGVVADDAGQSPLAIYRSFLEQGKLGYQVSGGDGKPVFFPRVLCPRTGSTDLIWHVSAGLGTVYATTVVHGAQSERFNVALIDVDEGFRLMSRVEGIAPEAVAIGMRVQVAVHRPADDEPYPVFLPVQAP